MCAFCLCTLHTSDKCAEEFDMVADHYPFFWDTNSHGWNDMLPVGFPFHAFCCAEHCRLWIIRERGKLVTDDTLLNILTALQNY